MKIGANQSLKFTSNAFSIGILLFTNPCFLHRELRGKVKPSKDHKTYLIIKEKNSENCEMYVDGKIWPYDVGIKGEIKAGVHEQLRLIFLKSIEGYRLPLRIGCKKLCLSVKNNLKNLPYRLKNKM